MPSPVNPPSGCRFHTRCWLRERLGNPERCATEDPVAPRSWRRGHEVACHFAEEVDGSTEQVQATGRTPADRVRGSGAPAPGDAAGRRPPGHPADRRRPRPPTVAPTGRSTRASSG